MTGKNNKPEIILNNFKFIIVPDSFKFKLTKKIRDKVAKAPKMASINFQTLLLPFKGNKYKVHLMMSGYRCSYRYISNTRGTDKTLELLVRLRSR